MKIIHDIRIDFQSTPRLWMAYREGTDFAEDSRPTYGLGKTPIEALAHLIEQELEAEEDQPSDIRRRNDQ